MKGTHTKVFFLDREIKVHENIDSMKLMRGQHHHMSQMVVTSAGVWGQRRC